MKKIVSQIRLFTLLRGNKIGIGLCFGLVFFLLFGCEKNQPEIVNETAPKVVALEDQQKAYVLQKEKFTPQVELTGNVEANKQVSINSAIGGRVAEIKVETGDFVKKGQVLVRLSANDNGAEIQYQNAVNTLSKAQNTVQNNIHQAEVGLENAQLSLEKMIKTQKETYENTFELLITQATSTRSTLKDVYYWADRTVLATDAARRGTSDVVYHNLGANQTIEKQAIRNEVQALYNECKEVEDAAAPSFVATPEGEKVVLDYAKGFLEVAQELRNIAFQINSLIVKTATHSSFTTAQRLQLQQESDGYLKTIDQTIVNLDNSIKNATNQRERYQEAILTGENQVRNAETGLELVKASSDGDINSAKNQIRIAQLSRNELTLTAPFDAVIIKKNTEAGQLVNAGMALLEIADMSKFKIKTAIPDVWASDAQNDGVQTEIKISGIRDKVFMGKIDKIEPAVDISTRKIGIEIAFDEVTEVIKIGMFARVVLSIPETEGFFVPRKYIKSDFDGAYVTLSDGTKKYVEKGFEENNRIQINFTGMEAGLELLK